MVQPRLTGFVQTAATKAPAPGADGRWTGPLKRLFRSGGIPAHYAAIILLAVTGVILNAVLMSNHKCSVKSQVGDSATICVYYYCAVFVDP